MISDKSQGSVAARLRCGGLLSYHLTVCLRGEKLDRLCSPVRLAMILLRDEELTTYNLPITNRIGTCRISGRFLIPGCSSGSNLPDNEPDILLIAKSCSRYLGKLQFVNKR